MVNSSAARHMYVCVVLEARCEVCAWIEYTVVPALSVMEKYSLPAEYL